MPRKKQLTAVELEKKLVNALGSMMGCIQEVREKGKPLADKYDRYETEYLILINMQILDDRVKQRFWRSYDAISRQADQLKQTYPRIKIDLGMAQPIIYRFVDYMRDNGEKSEFGKRTGRINRRRGLAND